jgi:hypothetical protein
MMTARKISGELFCRERSRGIQHSGVGPSVVFIKQLNVFFVHDALPRAVFK